MVSLACLDDDEATVAAWTLLYKNADGGVVTNSIEEGDVAQVLYAHGGQRYGYKCKVNRVDDPDGARAWNHLARMLARRLRVRLGLEPACVREAFAQRLRARGFSVRVGSEPCTCGTCVRQAALS